MKIRMDFVTNSSSSCFCVSLTLSFDNGEKLVCGDMDSIGEEYDDCSNEPKADIQSSCGGVTFSKIVESRKNISELKSILSSCFPKAKLAALKDATELTDARLSISGCARGEESWRITMYRLLGVDDVSLSDKSIEENVARLREAGMKAYQEKGLEEIVLYEDMGMGGAFKDKAKKYGITYDEYDLSKTIECSMTNKGDIAVSISPGSNFGGGINFRSLLSGLSGLSGFSWGNNDEDDEDDDEDEDESQTGITLEDLGKIKTVKKAEIGLDEGKYDEVVNALRTWIKEKHFPVAVETDDDLDSIFQKLSLSLRVYSDDNSMIFDNGETDCSGLCFPFAEFVKTISPFVYGGLFIVESEKMSNPMSILIVSVTYFSVESTREEKEIKIHEATEKEFDEGFPW